jgi:methylenetetrahydrofolate dehydrogenase (NADP+)/methenyltetrahydrofolate cyclohydrolase
MDSTLFMKGRAVAEACKEQILHKIAYARAHGRDAGLAILLVGDDPASKVYTGRLAKQAEKLGIKAEVVELSRSTSTKEVLAQVKRLNEDETVTGILPMMPMPSHIDGGAVGAAIAPEKDVDCLNPFSCGLLYLGRSEWAPCTPRACLATLKHYGIELAGKRVVILGRSNVVGKPAALLLLKENATVTICHSKTVNLPDICRQADILIAAIGRPGFVTPEMVKEGAVIVDVGINVVQDEIVGDVDPAAAKKAAALTPVPGGIGVVCNMMVMEALTRNL